MAVRKVTFTRLGLQLRVREGITNVSMCKIAQPAAVENEMMEETLYNILQVLLRLRLELLQVERRAFKRIRGLA